MGENNVEAKYLEILNIVKSGFSITKLCKERKICQANTRRMLKKLFPEDYDLLCHGKVLCVKKGFELRLIPRKQTDSNETNLTKEAKRFLMKEYGCFEEVGVWLDNFKKRYTVDLYSLKYDFGIELFWQNDMNFKKLLKKIRIYEMYFGSVIVALLKDSNVRSKDRSYILIKRKLKSSNIKFIVVDIAKEYPICERG